MLATRAPGAALRPFVRLLWAAAPAAGSSMAGWREHALPTGCMHIALRWSGPPLRVYADGADPHGHAVSHAVVGGARTGFYVREAGVPAWSAGAQLEPGAALALFGTAADELAERHTPLADLWGGVAQSCLDRLHAARDPRECLVLLEAFLLERVRDAAALHPAIAAALAVLRRGGRVEDAVRASGFSHRHLVARVREATGLGPKQHARVLRLQAALGQLGRGMMLADLALDAGYADQAHFSRDFHRFAGLTPTQWRQAAPAHPNHVPVGPRR